MVKLMNIGVVTKTCTVSYVHNEHRAWHKNVLGHQKCPNTSMLVSGPPIRQSTVLLKNQGRRHKQQNRCFILLPPIQITTVAAWPVGGTHTERIDILQSRNQMLPLFNRRFKMELTRPVGTDGHEVYPAEALRRGQWIIGDDTRHLWTATPLRKPHPNLF